MSPSRSTPTGAPSLVIFSFAGTLFATHPAIEHTIQLVFQTILPQLSPPSEREIHALISCGRTVAETFQALHSDPDIFVRAGELACWLSEFRRLYASAAGREMIRPFAGARQVLTHLRTQNVPVAVWSSDAADEVRDVLRNNNLVDLVDEKMVVGDDRKTPGMSDSTAAGCVANVLVPALREKGYLGEDETVDPETVLVIGDAAADIRFARRIGARVCWARYGYGDEDECEALGPEYVVEALGDVVKVVAGEQ